MKFSIFSSTVGIATMIAGLGVGTSVGHAAEYVWTGAITSASTDWFSAKNWKCTTSLSAPDSGFEAYDALDGALKTPSLRLSGVPGPGDTATIAAGATVIINQPVRLGALVVQENSVLQGLGAITITSKLTVKDAQLVGDGNLVIAPTASAEISGDSSVGTLVNKPIDNWGTLTWTSGKIALQKDFHNRGNFSIKSNATLQAAGLVKPTFYNEGTITKSDSANETSFTTPFVNSGDIYVESGKLNVGPRYTQTDGSLNLDGGNVASGGTLRVTGGKVGGTGSIYADVVNDGGLFKPGHSPGIINIYGNYTQTSNGTLGMEIGGTSVGTGYDQMNIYGIAYLDGTLNIIRYNNFSPPAGRNFELLTYYDSSTNFATINGRYPGGPIYYKVTKLPDIFVATTYSDTFAPTIAINTPANGGNYRGVSSVQGTASDGTKSGLNSITVVLYRYAGANPAGYWAGGTSWTSSNGVNNARLATGTTNWSLALPSLPAGQYSVKATAKDNVGNTTTTATNIFTISSSGSGYVALPKSQRPDSRLALATLNGK